VTAGSGYRRAPSGRNHRLIGVGVFLLTCATLLLSYRYFPLLLIPWALVSFSGTGFGFRTPLRRALSFGVL